MNHITLGLVAVFIAAALVIGTFAAATTTQSAFAWGKGKYKTYVKVGSTKNKCIEAADNSQHVAFGPGTQNSSATNEPVNDQDQTCNAGSTGAG